MATFAEKCSLLAVQHGIKSLAIVLRDPTTNQLVVIASPGAIADLRPVVAQKFNLVDPAAVSTEADTEWTP